MKSMFTVVLSVLLLTPIAAADDVREIEESFDIKGEQTLRIDFPVGELRIEGSGGNKVEAEFIIRCRWGAGDCEEALEGLHLKTRSSDSRLNLELDGFPKWHKKWLQTEGVIRMPKRNALDLDMGVGELEIEGLGSDLRVDIGVGEASLRLPEKKFETISLDVGVGEAELFGAHDRVAGRRSMLVGSEIYWNEGKGSSRVKVDIGVGEITVWLE